MCRPCTLTAVWLDLAADLDRDLGAVATALHHHASLTFTASEGPRTELAGFTGDNDFAITPMLSSWIARKLGLGRGTVKVHVAQTYAALGVRSRLDAVVKLGPVQHRRGDDAA
jgi:hypothetical protein